MDHYPRMRSQDFLWEISIWTSETLLLKMYPEQIPNLEWLRSTMLIVSGLCFRISSLQHFMCFLMNVVELISKIQWFFNILLVRVGVIWLCRWNDQVDGNWGLKSITDIEWTLSHRTVLSTIVTMLYVWEAFIPCPTMLVVVHAKQLYYQAIHNFRVSVCMRMETCRHKKYCVEMFP